MRTGKAVPVVMGSYWDILFGWEGEVVGRG